MIARIDCELQVFLYLTINHQDWSKYMMDYFKFIAPGSLCDIQPDRPLMKEIMAELNMCNECYTVEDHWEDIGIQLEVDYEELVYIRHRYHEEITHAHSFRDMIAKWLKQESFSPKSWPVLVEALQNSRCPEFADQLRSKYCK